MTDDAILLRRFSEFGDQAAFTEVVRRHLGWTVALAMRRLNGDRQMAEDAVQVAFAALARDGAGVAATRPVAPWLHRSVCFAAANALRGELRHRRRLEALMRHESAWPASEPPKSNDAEVLQAIDEILSHARASDRALLLMRFLEGQSVQEVAARLNLSDEGARKRIDRSLERMRRRMQARGIHSTTDAISGLLGQEGAIAAPLALVPMMSAGALKAAMTAGVAKAGFFVTLMNAKITTGVLTAIAITGAGMTAWEAIRIHEVSADVARVQMEARAELLGQPAHADATGRRGAGASRPMGTVEASREALEDFQGRLEKDFIQRRAGAVLSDLSKRKLWERAYRSTLELRLGPFFRAEGVPTAIANQVVNAEVEANARDMDLRTAARELGIPIPSPAFQAEYNQNQAELASQLSSLLGQDGYAAYQQFERTSPDRRIVQNLAQALYATSDPLTPAQDTQLTSLVVQNDSMAAHADVAQVSRSLSGVNWDAVADHTPSILSPNQMGTWNMVVTNQRWSDEMVRAINGYR